MHSNYMQSLQSTYEEDPTFQFQPTLHTSSSQTNQFANSENTPEAQERAQPQAQAQQQAAAQPARNRQANNDAIERDDDWLSMLHNVIYLLVLFSIIYYNSSLERFLLIISIVFILIL